MPDTPTPSPEAVEAVAQAIYRELVDKVGFYSIPDVAEAAARAALRAIDVAPLVEAAREVVSPCDFGNQGAWGRRWCIAHGEYDRGDGCPMGNLAAALATFDSPQGGPA